MKIYRLVAGILSIILSVFVAFQSMFAGLANTLENNGEVGGSAGIIVAMLLLTGGIVSIAVRNSVSKGAAIAMIVIFGIAALLGFSGAGNYSDLNIWAGWALINAVMAVISIVKKKA